MGWYKDAQNKPHWIADGPAATPVGPRDPMAPIKVQGGILGNSQTAAQTGRTVVQTRGDLIDNATKAATQAAIIAKAKADAQAAQAAAAAAQRDQRAKTAPLNALNNQLHTVWDLYAKGPGKTKGLAGLGDYLPTGQNSQFDAAAAGLAEIGQNAFRTPGVGSQSDKELAAFVQANRPSTSDFDPAIEQKMANLENRLAAQFKAYGMPYKPYRPAGFGGQAPAGAGKVIRYDAKGNRIP